MPEGSRLALDRRPSRSAPRACRRAPRMLRSMPARGAPSIDRDRRGSRRINAADRRSPGGPAGIIPSPWPGSFHGGLPWKARLPYPFPATTTLSEDFGCFRLLPRSSCYSYVLCVCIPITNSSCTACCMLLPDVTSINSNASSGTFFLYASQSCKKILMLLS